MFNSSPCPERKVNQWISKYLRIELIDGRVIIGKFVCTDNVPNLILTECMEFWKEREEMAMEGTDNLVKRNIGIVTIPGRHITKIFHEKK